MTLQEKSRHSQLLEAVTPKSVCCRRSVSYGIATYIHGLYRASDQNTVFNMLFNCRYLEYTDFPFHPMFYTQFNLAIGSVLEALLSAGHRNEGRGHWLSKGLRLGVLAVPSAGR